MDTVRARLRQLIERYWQLPRREGKALLAVLVQSDCSRAKLLRYHLALLDVALPTAHGAQECDARHTFAQVITPTFMIHLLADLKSAGSVSDKELRTMEKAILATVGREGAWRAVEE